MLSINDLQRHTLAVAGEVEQAVNRVLRSGWFVLGREVAAFEEEFAAYCQARHCVGVANGTDAIELSLRCLGIGPNDHVLTVANAGMYATTAILATGARPLFMDVDDETLLPNAKTMSDGLRQASNVRAVVITHLYGHVADVERLIPMAHAAGARVVEDCAQAHGASIHGKSVGTFGDLGCFSFYPSKNLGALGDGGAIVSDNPGFAGKLTSLRQYGWSTKYHSTVSNGRNSRLDELQAAVLRAKLPHLQEWNARRQAIAARYKASISHESVRCPIVRSNDEYVAHLFVVRSENRIGLKEHLAKCGIAADIHYPVADHQQPSLHSGSTTFLPVTEAACDQVLTIPCFPEMSDDEVEHVIAAINGWPN